jgi:hypothetical protein
MDHVIFTHPENTSSSRNSDTFKQTVSKRLMHKRRHDKAESHHSLFLQLVLWAKIVVCVPCELRAMSLNAKPLNMSSTNLLHYQLYITEWTLQESSLEN